MKEKVCLSLDPLKGNLIWIDSSLRWSWEHRPILSSGGNYNEHGWVWRGGGRDGATSGGGGVGLLKPKYCRKLAKALDWLGMHECRYINEK